MQNFQSKSDSLFDQIRHDILTLQLQPGSSLRLPALSKQYSIGTTPLRECLSRLGAEKLVVMEHNKGFKVSQLSYVDLMDLERSRSVIEGSLFAESVTLGDDSWEAEVVGSFHQLSKTPFPSIFLDVEIMELWTKRHAAFHKALIGAATSTWMLRFCDTLRDLLGRYHLFIQNSLKELSITQPELSVSSAKTFSVAMELGPHRKLYEVALSRDANKAKSVFADHSDLTTRAFERLINMMPANDLVATLGKSQI